MSRVFEIISLDVWGNVDDGFTVNQAFNTGRTITVDDVDSDASIIEALIGGEYLSNKATEQHITITGDNDYDLYIDETENGQPLWQLRAINN